MQQAFGYTKSHKCKAENIRFQLLLQSAQKTLPGFLGPFGRRTALPPELPPVPFDDGLDDEDEDVTTPPTLLPAPMTGRRTADRPPVPASISFFRLEGSLSSFSRSFSAAARSRSTAI